MANELKKKVTFDVNSKQLTDALKTFKGMDAALASMLKMQQSILSVMNQIVAKQKADIDSEKKKNKLVSDNLKKEKEITKTTKERALQQKKEAFEKAQKEFNENPAQRARERMREDWERGKQYKTYPGSLKGVTQMLFDRKQEDIARSGELEVRGFDEELAKLADMKKMNTAEIDYLGESAKKTKKGEIDKRSKEYKQIQSLNKANEGLNQKSEDIKDKKSQSIGNTKTQANKYAAIAAAAQKVAGQLEQLGKAALNVALKPFKELYSEVSKTVTAMLDFRNGVATYNTAGSLITNTAAREQQMKYGLSSSQNYAFSKTKEMLNIQSDEDLMYMNGAQREKFLSYMERYSAWYDELESSGVLADIQEMQLEFAELKEEIAMEFLQWVAENKEVIMSCIRGIFEFVKIVAKGILEVINLITMLTGGNGTLGGIDLDSASDSINNNNDNSRNTNITINANTTNNATGVLGSQEALDNFNKENWANLAKQVVGVIGG